MERLEQILRAALATAAAGLVPTQGFAGDVTGEIVSVDARTVSIRHPDGETTRYEFDPEVAVSCAAEPVVSVLDLRQGQSVTVTFADPHHDDADPTALHIQLDDDTNIDPRWRFRQVERISHERRER